MNEESFAGAGRAVGCLGIVVGVLATIVGLALAGVQVYELSRMEETYGVAIKYEPGMKGSGPHVRYTVDGKDHVTSASSYHEDSFSSGVRVGDEVLVHYWKNDPANAKVGLFYELWFAPIFVTGVGMVFCAIASILALTQKKS